MSVFVDKFTDISRIALWADGVNENKAKLVFGFRDGVPRITVYTGLNTKEGVISFPSDITTFVYILNLIKEAAKAEPGFKQQIQCLVTVYQDNKPTTEKKILSTLFIGKSKEGFVYISVITEDKPKIVFTFKQSPFYVFRDKDGNFVDEKEISEKIATTMADLLLNVVASSYVEITKEDFTLKRKPTPIKSKIENDLVVEELDNLSI